MPQFKSFSQKGFSSQIIILIILGLAILGGLVLLKEPKIFSPKAYYPDQSITKTLQEEPISYGNNCTISGSTETKMCETGLSCIEGICVYPDNSQERYENCGKSKECVGVDSEGRVLECIGKDSYDDSKNASHGREYLGNLQSGNGSCLSYHLFEEGIQCSYDFECIEGLSCKTHTLMDSQQQRPYKVDICFPKDSPLN